MQMKLIITLFALTISMTFVSVGYADEMYGVFMVVKGDVKIKSVKTGKEEPAKIGSKVFPGDQVITAADSRGKIVMSDRNVLAISPDSNMQIAKYENDASKGSKNVELNLSSGKVRANVEQKYDGEKNKFMIKSPTAVAGVRGTKFMMGFDPSTQVSSVVTFSGQVQFGNPAPGGGIANPVMVNPGQMTSAAPGQSAEQPKVVPKEDMKKMDAESQGEAPPAQSSTAAPAAENKAEAKEQKDNANAEAKPADNNKQENAKSETTAGDKPAGADNNAKQDTNKAEGGNKPGPSSSQQADGAGKPAPANGPAPGNAPPPPPTSSMVSAGDMKMDMMKDVQISPMGPAMGAAAPPPQSNPMNKTIVQQPIQNDFIKNTIQNSSGPAKVIIVPK